MGRPRKNPVIIPEEKTEIVKSGTESVFELSAEITAGKLTSNAKELRAAIENELKNYNVERYIGNPDAAKTDKAFLNKVKDSVSAKRREITKAWNAPLDEFLEEMKSLETSISDAYTGLNNIVMYAKEKEKEDKKKQIENVYTTLSVNDYVSFDRILSMNPKWMNNGTSVKQILVDIDTFSDKFFSEMSTIKSMSGEDTETLIAFYLETLNLAATIQKGNELKARKIQAKEFAEKQEKCVKTPENASENQENAEKLQNSSFQQQKTEDEILSYKLEIFGTRQQLMRLRQFIDMNGFRYNKLS